MAYEVGGRSDKSGNRYEIRVVIHYLLQIIEEKYDYLILEAIGDDEKGVDIWIGHKDGKKEGIQCKGRNGSEEKWTFGAANNKGIFTNWRRQLDRSEFNMVSLASPLAFTILEDIINMANMSNDNIKDFYNFQILKSGKPTKSFVDSFCEVMGVNKELDNDLERMFRYFKRIKYHQLPDSELQDIILSKISYLFSGDSNKIYDTLISWIIKGEMLAKKIDFMVLEQFFRDNDINYKNLSKDKRINPRINQLNDEYKMSFQPLNDGMIIRKEFNECIKLVEDGKSIIIHGKAGIGKTGFTHNIINYCEKENIRYLAIKLDKRIPISTAEKWGQEIGLPDSIAHCINSVSTDKKAVIILDQLDALRWTQSHSGSALTVCSEIIKQVKMFNKEREDNKISVIFVCRTYDIDNDNNIKSLFNNAKNEKVEWDRIEIDEFSDEQVEDIVGKKYLSLTAKLRSLLRIPSNIYIWQHLDYNNNYDECFTTNHLIDKWWEQISEKYVYSGYIESDLIKTKKKLVDQFDKMGRIAIPSKCIDFNKHVLNFLHSSGFLIIQNQTLSFVHQSILDCLLAQKMLQEYYDEGLCIEQIIGDKEKQTPGRRYQLQMLMQNIREYSKKDLIDFGTKLLDSEKIRFSYKFVFFEVINQIEDIDNNISNFIVEYCENEYWGKYIINSVIYSKTKFYSIIRDNGILDKWFNSSNRKESVFNLLISISPNYSSKDINFIRKYAFKHEEDDENFFRCFSYDICEDSDDMFELRMEFYNKYPIFANRYIDFKSSIKNCELRTIRFFSFLLENKVRKKETEIYKYEDSFSCDDTEILINKGEEVLRLLLPYIRNAEIENAFNKWSGRYINSSLERTCVEIVKKANDSIISKKPDLIWKYLESYSKFNEIILDIFIKLPTKYSDRIISYICDDFDNKIIDNTSGNGDKLFLIKEIIKKHVESCSEKIYFILEDRIVFYKPPRMKEDYKRRIEYNKTNSENYYISFWGDLQYELLNSILESRLRKSAKDLLKVLERKFNKGTQKYRYSFGGGGLVSYPVSKKQLSVNNWKEIILSKKLKREKGLRWKNAPGGIVESSIEKFSRSFSNVVSKAPNDMLKMVLSINETVEDIFIDALYSGLAYSEKLDSADDSMIENLILRYSYDYDSYRANYICEIIEKKSTVDWSQEIINILIDIAINHNDPKIENPNVKSSDDKEMDSFDLLFSNSINCVRGNAARTLGSLLKSNSNYFDIFKETIEKQIEDTNPVVRLATMFILFPAYDIDKDWSAKNIIKLLKGDYRLTGFPRMRHMFFLLYSEHREFVVEIIKKCYYSDDKDLVTVGSLCVSEMYITKGEFKDIILDVKNTNEDQARQILLMTTQYFKIDKYNDIAKDIILLYKDSELDLGVDIFELYDDSIDLDRDEEFLVKLMSSRLSRMTIYSFTKYLEKKPISLISFKNVIFALMDILIEKKIGLEETRWFMADSVSRLIISLYDDVSSDVDRKYKDIANQCLDYWDLMFENEIGSARVLSKEMMMR